MQGNRSNEPPQGQKIGVLGGSFDPVHRGHLHVADAALAAFKLDRVLFVPAARPPHKPDRVLAAGEHRMAMLELALADRDHFETWDGELNRAGPSYTLQTILELREQFGSDSALHLIVGSDNLAGLPTWHRVHELLELVQPIVVLRRGSPRNVLNQLAKSLSGPELESLARGFLETEPVDLSSTQLRVELQGGENVAAKLPTGVWEYLREKNLYHQP